MNTENAKNELGGGELENYFISLSEASKISGYTPEHLNLLCRKGILQGKKIGRNWHTTREWLNEFLYLSKSKSENIFITLAKASKISGYTPEHLNLLCRKGILQGKKIGRNWHTTREWLNEFLYLSGSHENKKYLRRHKKRKGKILTEDKKEEIFQEEEKQKKEEKQKIVSLLSFKRGVVESEKILPEEKNSIEKISHPFGKMFLRFSLTCFASLFLFFSFSFFQYIQNQRMISERKFPSEITEDIFLDENGKGIVAGEENIQGDENQNQRAIAVSENFRLKEISFGGVLLASANGENLDLEITDVKSDVFTTKDGKQAQILISWKTNKMASSEIDYSKNNSSSQKQLQEKGYGFNHSVILTKLDLASTYIYQIKAQDRWGNEISSERFGIYTGSKMVSVFDLILKAVNETFSWAIKK